MSGGPHRLPLLRSKKQKHLVTRQFVIIPIVHELGNRMPIAEPYMGEISLFIKDQERQNIITRGANPGGGGGVHP